MADEQYIYLSQEEDVTSVRERLQKTPNRRIVLVVPPQTQLRSHVSWRLLHARARELGKDISINSPDRQIRSVAKAVGFRVVDSLETPSSSKSRTGSKPSRSGLGGRTSPRLRTPPIKSSNPPQQFSPVQENRTEQRAGQGTPPARGNTFEETLPPARENRDEQNQPPIRGSRPAQNIPIPPVMGNIPVQGEQATPQYDNHSWTQPEDIVTGGFPPAYEADDYSLSPSSSKHSRGSSFEDEEHDLFLEDFRNAQSIREAAQPAKPPQPQDSDTFMPAMGQTVDSGETPHIIDLSSTQQNVEDPLAFIADEQSPSLPEQRASVSFHEPDEDVHDISDEPTGHLQIEDLGDTDEDYFNHPHAGSPGLPGSPALDWRDEMPDEEQDIQDIPGPPRVHGVHPRSSRAGSIQQPRQPVQPVQSDFDGEDVMLPPPVYDQRTRSPYSGARASQADEQAPYPVKSGGNRPPQAVPLPPARQARTQSARPKATQTRQQRPGGPGGKGTRGAPGTAVPAARTAQSQKRKKKSSASLGLGVTVLLSMLILFLIGLLAFLVPSANVTMTLQSHEYSLKGEMIANSSSQLNTIHHTVPAQPLKYETNATGTAHATGSTSVGTVQATGTVTFTNNGSSSVVVPNGTVVATKNNVQFATQAEVLVLSGASNTNLAPVQAQSAGTTGNVDTNSITVIPPDSLSKILAANPSTSNLNLSVNNTTPTTGGGAGSATTVTNKDVSALKQQLDLQLQSNVNAFIKKQLGSGDQQGKIVQVESAPVVTPAVGQIVTNGNFMMTLKLQISVLVVKAATIQTAAAAQMNAALAKLNNGLALVPQQKLQITKIANNASKDGSSMTLNYTAVGQVAPKFSDDTVRQLVSGKSVSDAQNALKGTGGIPDVTGAHVTVSPGFIGWVTFYTPHISVHYNAVPAPTKAVPKKK
jgi:Baseplate J-like protein